LYEVICDSCTDEPTSTPTLAPTADPTTDPTGVPSVEPTSDPTSDPTTDPTGAPSVEPTHDPTSDPTVDPSPQPTIDPTEVPTFGPTVEPTPAPSTTPTLNPTSDPTSDPTVDPTNLPTTEPSRTPTAEPTSEPTLDPTVPTSDPTTSPTSDPTSSPTHEPTADPTSERRRKSDFDMNPNVLLILSEGSGFGSSEFKTPEVDEFFTEGYTFNNVKQPLEGNLMTGKSEGETTWVEGMRSKGYSNYYYGNLQLNTDSPVLRGWDFFYGTSSQQNKLVGAAGDDLTMEKVQSRLSMLQDEKWTITVNWTSAESYSKSNLAKPALFDACRKYFQVGSTSFNYENGVRCQWTLHHDAMFGKLLKTLKSTDLWMRTIVMFVITGPQKNIFSFSGGALPANLLHRTNEDRHSIVDVLPTILAVGGFSESELERFNFDGFAVFRMNQN